MQTTSAPQVVPVGGNPIDSRRLVDRILREQHLRSRSFLTSFLATTAFAVIGFAGYWWLIGRGTPISSPLFPLQVLGIGFLMTLLQKRQVISAFIKSNELLMEGGNRTLLSPRGFWLEADPEKLLCWADIRDIRRNKSFFAITTNSGEFAYLPFEYFKSPEEIDYFEKVARHFMPSSTG